MSKLAVVAEFEHHLPGGAYAHECQLFPPLRWCSERNDD